MVSSGFGSPFGSGVSAPTGGGFNVSTALTSGLSYLPVLNVGSNGGVADGTTDNYAVIRQAIIDANALGGGIVYLGPGTWLISRAPLLRTGVRLMGAGRGVTILKASSTYADAAIIAPVSTTVADAGFSDMTIDMNAGSVTANRSKSPVVFTGCSRITMERFGIRGVRHDGTNGCNAIKLVSSGGVSDVAGSQFVIRDWYIEVSYVLGPGVIFIGSSSGYVKGATDVIIEPGVIDYSGLLNTTPGTAFAYGICTDLKQPSAMDPNRHSQRVRIRGVTFISPPAPAIIQFGTAADVYGTGCHVTGATKGMLFDGVTESACLGYVSSFYPDYAYNTTYWTFSGSGLSATPTYSINLTVENSTFESVPTNAYACAVTDGGTGGGSKARGVVFRGITGRNCYGAQIDGIGTVLEDCDFEGPYTDATNGIVVLGTAVAPSLKGNSLRGHSHAYDVQSGATDTRISHRYHSGITGTIVNDSGTRTQAEGYGLSARGSATITDGGTITHGLAQTPRWARVQGSVAGEFVSVTALGSTTLTTAIKTHANGAGSSQTGYWEAGY